MIKKALIVLLILILGSAYAYEHFFKPPIVKTEWKEVSKIKEVIKVKTVRVPVKEIVVLNKQELNKKFPQPQEIVNDAKKQVIATGEIEPYEGKTDVEAVINTESGESTMISKQRPLPFFAIESKKEIGIGVGISSKGIDGELYAQYSFLRTGKVHWKGYGEIGRLGAKALIRVGYEF